MSSPGKNPLGATLAQLDQFDEIIDVRTPAEFAEDHIPGAINCPVLDDDERIRVGTLYKQVSPFEANKVGAALVARNIARHIETLFHARPKNWKPLIYCWRGGKRSGAMTIIFSQIGWQARQLEGGYKTYRHMVNAELDSLPQRLRYLTVCGPTGSGKSALLQALHAAGGQVLDLEQLARHKGSVLGQLPDAQQPSQKMFESQLLLQLLDFDPARLVYVESESSKVGSLRVPRPLIDSIRAAPCIVIDAPLAARVDFLLRDYAYLLTQPDWLLDRLQRLTELHGRQTIERWCGLVERQAWPELVGALLQEHYDPAYIKSMKHHFARLESAQVIKLPQIDTAQLADSARQLLAR
ncbi:tRNA 2-selenouridine(34) synthase MnmH [Chitinivorax sp. PXF-14]|uniref:tRNA 2-selenouridine(34) synthase MnmH n=1 Tax=Chitinivorax sp. PXF-14 TaxID=3230488 RepID=UPI00346688BB